MNDDFLIFGIRRDHLNVKNPDDDMDTRLIIIDRNSDEVCYDEPLNEKNSDAGIMKMTIDDGYLHYLDQFGYLHEIELRQFKSG